MKTINFELSKRLNDLGLLDDMNPEFRYVGKDTYYDNPVYYGVGEYSHTDNICIPEGFKFNPSTDIFNKNIEYNLFFAEHRIKTLTLSEAIEFLPICLIKHKRSERQLTIIKNTIGYYVGYDGFTFFNEKTLLLAIEKMLEYLLDNNLLFKK